MTEELKDTPQADENTVWEQDAEITRLRDQLEHEIDARLKKSTECIRIAAERAKDGQTYQKARDSFQAQIRELRERENTLRDALNNASARAMSAETKLADAKLDLEVRLAASTLPGDGSSDPEANKLVKDLREEIKTLVADRDALSAKVEATLDERDAALAACEAAKLDREKVHADGESKLYALRTAFLQMQVKFADTAAALAGHEQRVARQQLEKHQSDTAKKAN